MAEFDGIVPSRKAWDQLKKYVQQWSREAVPKIRPRPRRTVTGGGGCPRQNAKQQLIIFGMPTAGTFTLTLDGQTTSAIAYDADAGDVEDALEALSNVGSGNVSVTGGPNLPNATMTIEFVEDLENTDVPTLTGNWNNLTGGIGVAAAVTVTQQGHARDWE